MPRQKLSHNDENIEEFNMDTVATTQIHQVLRTISRLNVSNHEANIWTIAETDEYLNSWFANGWKLNNTHFVGEVPEGYKMIYVLLKE